jgi:hypothetical protein
LAAFMAALVRSLISLRSFSASAAQQKRVGVGAQLGHDERHAMFLQSFQPLVSTRHLEADF